MDPGPGISLFEPSDVKLNIKNQHEEDEEEIEEQKRRNEVLKAQLEHAFDDWSEEDDTNGDDHGSSCSSNEGDGTHDSSNTNQSNHHSNEMKVFHNLSDISEHSPNKSGYHSSDVSKDNGRGHSDVPNKNIFSSPRSLPYKVVQANGGATDYITAMDGRGDADQTYQPIFKNISSFENTEKFQPIFSNKSFSEKLHSSISNSSEAYRQAEYNSPEQFQVLYEVRLREIQRLTNLLEAERTDAAKHKQEAFRKLALLEAEKERAVLSRTESNKLLVANKEETAKLQKEIQTLKQNYTTLEKDKIKSDELVELSKVQIQELEQRIALMERFDSNKNSIKQTDIMVKDIKNKHQQEVKLLQREIDTLNKKLMRKDEDCINLEQKVSELQRTQEILLVEKSETINQLARRLEESQAQCGQLMSSNVSVDNVRLQNQLADALKEKEELNQTVKNLQTQCSMMQSDLAQYESVSRLNLPQSNSSSDETDSIVQMGISGNKSKLSNLNITDNTSKLRDELHRALINQKAKRLEIHRLQEMMSSKDKQIQEMTQQERIYLAQTETLREQLNKMMTEIKSLREKHEFKGNSNDKSEEISLLNAQIAELRKDKAVIEREKIETQRKLDEMIKHYDEEKRREISDHNKEYLKFHDETVTKVRKEAEEEAELKIKEYRIRLEQSLKEVSELKEMYVSVCAAKEQLAYSLSETTAQLQQMTVERDCLSGELQKNKQVCDQLARQLNDSSGSKDNSQVMQELSEQREQLRSEFDKCIEMRDHLARRVNSLERDNDKLTAEVEKLQAKFDNNPPCNTKNKVCSECLLLQEQLSAMSARHTQELSSARTELQAARDRVVQLEKCARLQFETEIKSLRQDRDMLKSKCDDKEVQIKKLIESRKRPPPVVNISTQTESLRTEDVDVERLEERHRRELARCREEYNNTLAIMEQAHQEALVTASNKNKDDIERLQEKHQQILVAVRQQLEQQEARMKAVHLQELLAVEERTKQLTVEFFAGEVKRLEAKYIEEACRRPDPSLIESLQKQLLDKTREIENLKQKLKTLNEEFRQKVTELQSQMEADKESASQMMLQWAQEMKNIQGELKLKEAIIDDQRSKIEKAKCIAKKYRNKLIKTNEEIKSQYLSKCEEYKAQMIAMIEEDEKKVYEKIRQMEQVYEKDLKMKISKKQHIT